ncbi:MAG: tyrosine--tRNA ligase [Ignavibacteriales bacterium]|nr:tyrosine--tRNA ligase [Ignavibacteriales bacterium]
MDNADWLLPLNYIAFLRDIGRHFSVNRMLAAEAYKLRLEKGLSFIEFNYQLLQAYDYLTLYRRHGCTLQMGGDDQWGNILAGIDLIRRVEGGTARGPDLPAADHGLGGQDGQDRPRAPCGSTPGSSAPTISTSTGSTATTGTSAASCASSPSCPSTRSGDWKPSGTAASTRPSGSWLTRRPRSPTASSRPTRPAAAAAAAFGGKPDPGVAGDVADLPTTAVPRLAARGGRLAGRPVHRGRPDTVAQGGQADDRAGRPLRQRRACRLDRALGHGQGPRAGRRHHPQGRQEEGPPDRPRLRPGPEFLCVARPSVFY